MPTTITDFDAALCLARQALYRFGSMALLDPRTGTFDALADAPARRIVTDAAAVVRDEEAAVSRELAPGERPLAQLDPAPVFARLPKTAAELNATYERTFGLLASGNCPPYETEYIPSRFTFQRSQGLGDIAGYYRAFGFDVATGHPERHDHVALELEFMALLLSLERRAAESDSPGADERRTVCREAQEKFFAQHVAWWLPALAKLLGRQDPDGYYDAVGRFLAALVAAERAILGVPVSASSSPQPTVIERPEECQGCELAI